VSLLRKVLPSPLASAALFALWLVLARTPTAGQIMLALAFAIAVPLGTSNLRPPGVRVRRPLLVVRFILMVGADVVRSSLEVGWGVVRWRWRRPRTKFVVVPLELHDPVGLAALAMVTTVVPGTVWSELAVDRSALLLHVWDVGDEPAFVARFKDRYEKPLREIFE
jgi:multicomponent K+:H+ antiporter subunit E